MVDGRTVTIEAELSNRRPVAHHGQPADGPAAQRSPRRAADHRVLARGHRGGPVRAGRAPAVPRRDAWRWSIRRRPGRPRTWRRSCASGRPCCGRRAGSSSAGGGQHPRRLGRPARRGRHRLVEAREALVDRAGPDRRQPTTRDWPARPTTVDAGLPALVVGSAARCAGRNPDQGRRAGRLADRAPPGRARAVPRRACPSRTHASQGEQRSLALALQLAAHQLATERLGTPPVLLLDDVFSELDPFRAKALLAGLPPGQALLTTALPAPVEVAAAKIYAVDAGGHRPRSTRTKGRAHEPARHNERRNGPTRLDASLDAVTRQLGLEGLEGPRAALREVARDRRHGHGRPRPADPTRQPVPGGGRRSPGLGHPGPRSRRRTRWTGWWRKPEPHGPPGWRCGCAG